MNDVIIEVNDLCKSYHQGENRLVVLNGLNFKVHCGERLAIVGLSGSGKSTLLHLLGGLDRADDGKVILFGHDLFNLEETQLCLVRNKLLGFVYQFHHLLSEFSAVENVAMPLLIGGQPRRLALGMAAKGLADVGLENRLGHRPAALSGGERQRVAVARALVGKPLCVLADEPTGNLDETSAAQVDQLMLNLSDQYGISFVVVTHNMQLAARMDKILRLHNGMFA